MPGEKKKLNQRELALQEKLNIPGLGPFEEIGRGLPPIERAPMFRPQTQLQGFGTFEANELEKLYRLAPQLRGRVNKITLGMGPMFLRTLGGNEEASPAYTRNTPTAFTGIGGYAGWKGSEKGNIEIDNYLNSEFIGNLAHELGHITGLRQKEKLEKNQGFFERFLNPNAIKNDPIVQWGTDEPDLKPGFGTYQTGQLANRNYNPLSNNPDVNLPIETSILPRSVIDAVKAKKLMEERALTEVYNKSKVKR